MRRLLLPCAVVLAAAALPTGAGAVASPTVRMAIVHAVHGCHVWGTSDSRPLGPTRTVALKRGQALEIRVNCPMDFDFVQLAGPRLALGDPRSISGTVRRIVFAKRGLYKLQATNVESSQQQNLQTLGPDNVLVLTVRVD